MVSQYFSTKDHIIISICFLVRGSRPGGQLVTSEWRLGPGSWLASSLGSIVVEVDGRGAGGQGLAWQSLLGTPALHLSTVLYTVWIVNRAVNN